MLQYLVANVNTRARKKEVSVTVGKVMLFTAKSTKLDLNVAMFGVVSIHLKALLMLQPLSLLTQPTALPFLLGTCFRSQISKSK